MSRAGWERVEELYHAALELAPDERAAFLAEACASDAELLREVLSLLRADEENAGFLERPAADALTRETPGPLPAVAAAAAPTASRLFAWGHLDVLEKVGEGGFGDVYRAWDPRLEREVALKLLKEGRARQVEHRASAVREGRILARIKNPHVVTVYGADERDGRVGIWMEFLSGRSLDQLLRERGELSHREAIVVGIDLCRGLAAVHREGVVHGDLKAANVIRETGGRLVLMDFGIGVDLASDAPRLKAGTPAYMAPELLDGAAPSVASDLFALGVLLHLLVSGRLPGGGAATESAARSSRGGLRDLRPGLPQRFLAVVERALAADPADRFASAGEMERELVLALAASGANPLPSPLGAAPEAVMEPAARHPRRRGVGSGIALGLLGTAAIAWVASDRLFRDAADVVVAEPRPLTSYAGVELQPALSPQADRVAFQRRGPDQNDDIWVKLLDEEPPLRLTDDATSECCPAWSPDGQRVAFLRTNGPAPGIYDVPSLGGRERFLHAVRPWFGSSLAWTPDGAAILFSAASAPDERRRIWMLSLATGEVRAVTSPPATALGDAFPSLSPDGRRVAFSRIEASGDLLTAADLYVTSVGDVSARRLTSRAAFIGGLDWTPDGEHVVFATRSGEALELRRVPSGGGDAEVLAVPWPHSIDRTSESPDVPSRAHRISFARSRAMLAFADARFDLNIWRLALPELEPATPLIASTYSDAGPAPSPDGSEIAFESRRSGASEVWSCDAAGAGCTVLTRLGGHSGSPSWSPDGRLIAFDARPDQNADVYLLDVASQRQRRLTMHGAEDVIPSWSADGRRVYFTSDRSGRWEIWRKPVSGGDSAFQVTRTGGFSSAESPDGRWLYHARLGQPGLWRVPVDGGDAERVTGDVGCWGYWAAADAGVYFVTTSLERPELMLLPWDSTTATSLGEVLDLPACGNRGLAIAPDGRSLLLVRMDLAEGNLLLVEMPD